MNLICEVIVKSPAQMFTNIENNAKMALDYGRDPVWKGTNQIFYR